jgi:hypothetical protein
MHILYDNLLSFEKFALHIAIISSSEFIIRSSNTPAEAIEMAQLLES